MELKDLKPSTFTSFPNRSVLEKFEPEQIARNVMIILKRTGDKFRDLSWREYKKERLKDGDFTDSEQGFFEQIKKYCISPAAAICFCQKWEAAARKLCPELK